MLKRLIDSAQESGKVATLVENVRAGSGHLILSGWAGSGKAWVLAAALERLNRNLTVVCPSDQQARQMKEDLATFLGEEKARLFPGWELKLLQPEVPDPEVVSERFETLLALLEKRKCIVVTSVAALHQPSLTPECFQSSLVKLKLGQETEVADLVTALERLGFKRTAWVEEVGDYSVRGGILDLFPYSLANPVRIEFFGNQIESIRTFSVLSQRSTEKLDRVTICPLREYNLTTQQLNRALDNLDPRSKKVLGWEFFWDFKIRLWWIICLRKRFCSWMTRMR
jgi:transcription-repair coupling factor (superfamily II helicase)